MHGTMAICFGKQRFRPNTRCLSLSTQASTQTHTTYCCLWDYLQFDSSLVCETRYYRSTLHWLSLYSVWKLNLYIPYCMLVNEINTNWTEIIWNISRILGTAWSTLRSPHVAVFRGLPTAINQISDKYHNSDCFLLIRAYGDKMIIDKAQ